MKRVARVTIFLVLLAVGFVASDFRGAGDFHGDDERTATSLGVGDTARGQIHHNYDIHDYDTDWFSFPAEAGQSYLISLKAGALSQSAVWVIDPDESPSYIVNSSRLGSARSGSVFGLDCSLFSCIWRTHTFPWTARATGTHYFNVSGVSQSGDSILGTEGTYTISVTNFADDHPNHLRDAVPIAVDSSTPGNIDVAGDQDWFTFEAVQGQTYEISAEGGSPNHSVQVVEWKNWSPRYSGLYTLGDRASQFVWTAQDTKAHYVLVNGIRNRTGDYTLTLTKQDDLGERIREARPLRLNERVEGELTFDGAADWYRLQVPDGQHPVILLEYHSSQVTDVSLYDSDGTALEKCWIEGTSRVAEYRWLTERPGGYYLSLAEHIAYEDLSPSYAVIYTVTPAEDQAGCF